MILIGMTGPIGHGKSTFAKGLELVEPKTTHLESSLIIADVANALHAATQKIPDRDDLKSINEWLKVLPGILEIIVHTSCQPDSLVIDTESVEKHPIEYEKLFLHIENLNRQPELIRQRITAENKENFRPILQWLGGYLVKKVDAGIWYREAVNRAKQAGAEGSQICVIGGLRFPTDAVIVREAGGIVVKVYRPGHLQYDMLDPTERERDNIIVDTTVMSNGTIEDMYRCAGVVLKDIKNSTLQKLYRTADA